MDQDYYIWICPECGRQCHWTGDAGWCCPNSLHRSNAERVRVVVPEQALTDEMVERAAKAMYENWTGLPWEVQDTPGESLSQKQSGARQVARDLLLAAGPWSGVEPLDRELTDENERLRDENRKLCEYVKEAAGDESVLLPIATLSTLVVALDREKAIDRVMGFRRDGMRWTNREWAERVVDALLGLRGGIVFTEEERAEVLDAVCFPARDTRGSQLRQSARIKIQNAL